MHSDLEAGGAVSPLGKEQQLPTRAIVLVRHVQAVGCKLSIPLTLCQNKSLRTIDGELS